MYKGRLFTRERITESGDRLEVEIYPVFQPAGKRRKKCNPSSEVQQRLNEKNSVLAAIRIAEANFGVGDLMIHLTYEREPETPEEAKRLLRNYLARVKRRYAKEGKELKYMVRTEKGKKSGRLHHHLYITGGISRDEAEDMWREGTANARRIQPAKDGLAGLTAYVAGSGKADQRVSRRRWSCSKNCVRPTVTERDGKMSVARADEIGEAAEKGLGANWFEADYPGYTVVSIEGVKNQFNRGWYTHVVMRRKQGGRPDGEKPEKKKRE